MLLETLRPLFSRDLAKLRKEIEAYSNESNIWKIEHSIANSGGNLALHLIGNLKTYVGKELGAIDYVRNRDLEFSQKNVPRADLLRMIDETKDTVERALQKVTDADLAKQYPVKVFENTTTTEYFLVHLAMHLSYHLGQVNYHRRLIDR